MTDEKVVGFTIYRPLSSIRSLVGVGPLNDLPTCAPYHCYLVTVDVQGYGWPETTTDPLCTVPLRALAEYLFPEEQP